MNEEIRLSLIERKVGLIGKRLRRFLASALDDEIGYVETLALRRNSVGHPEDGDSRRLTASSG